MEYQMETVPESMYIDDEVKEKGQRRHGKGTYWREA